MRQSLALLAAVCLLSASSTDRIAAQQARPAETTPVSIDELLTAVRAGLQANRADLMAKEHVADGRAAAKFWPVYNAYQKEQNVIMDDQLKGVQRYIETFDKLDDAGALAFIKAHLDRDAQMTSLRQKWLGEFQKALGTKLAVRALQIDRRLSLAYQLEMSTKIPLSQ